MKNLTGKTALITGGASGIGLAIGRRLAESGMKIALADIETPILEEAVSELKELNYEAIGIQCDVSDLDSMKGMKKLKDEHKWPLRSLVKLPRLLEILN